VPRKHMALLCLLMGPFAFSGLARGDVGVQVGKRVVEVPASATAVPDRERTPAVLFVTTEYNPTYNLYLKKYCRDVMVKNGFETDIALWNEVRWERVRHFNVIVIVSVGFNTAYGKFPEADRQVLEVFRRFVGEGGGLFVSAIEYNRLHVAQKLLVPYGLTPYDEVVKVRDRSQMYEATYFTNCFFAYTGNIEGSPLTEGVKGVWFPILSQKNWPTLEYTFEADSSWQILVRGMDYTYSEPVTGAGHGYAGNPHIVSREEGCSSEVPLFAVKDGEAGRLAYLSICPVLTYYSGLSPGIGGVVLSKGVGERPSDVGKLLLNAFRWLAEPSLKSGKLGGFMTDPKRIARAKTPPEEWLLHGRLEYPPPFAAFKGIIGAESSYSGGRSTLAEYREAAQAAGLDYVVFLEDVTLMDEARYKSFVAECQKLSDDEVTLIPGFHVEDETGNHWYSVSYAAPFPDPSMFTPDGKKFRSIFDPKGGGGWISAGRYYTSYFPFFGNYLYGRSGTPYWDFRDYCSTAIFTYEDGELADELPLRHFLELQDVGNWLSPIAVNAIKSADAVEKVFDQQQFITVILKKSRNDLAREGPGFGHQKPLTYVTNGPEILNWQSCVNRAYTAFHWFAWPQYRWNVRFKVRSDRGLREVAVYDGAELFRRFLPKGAKEYEQELNLVHQQQKELTLVVTDVAGRRAISDVLWDESFLLKDYFLSDRYNKGVYSQQPADSEWGFSRAWMPAVPGLYFMHGTFSDDVFYLINGSDLIAAGFDGPPGGKPVVRSAVSLDIEGHPYLDGWRFARRIDRPMASSDIIIGEAGFTERYPEDCGRWFGGGVMSPTRESEFYEGKQRYYCFNIRYGMPGIVLVEGEVKIKRDVRMSPNRHIPLRLGTIISDKHSKLDTFYCSGDGRVVKFNFENAPQDRNLEGPLPKYSYLTLFPSPWGSITIYSLTDNLGYFYEIKGICAFGFALRGRKVKKGTVFKYRYLAMTGDRKWNPSNAMTERIKNYMGIGGGPRYKLDLEQGTIISQEFICRLDGRNTGVAGTFPVKGLPCTLPVVVENLNDRWSSILYERNRKRYRPIGMLENAAYVQLGVGAEDPHLFIGHPFTCDTEEVFLTLVQTGESEFVLSLHNPTDRQLDVTVSKSPAFDLVEFERRRVTIPAGATVTVPMK